MKMYRVTKWSDKIDEIEITKKTNKTVFYETEHKDVWSEKIKIRKNYERISSEYQTWFDTWDEAHQFLLDKVKERWEHLWQELYIAKQDMDFAKAMKKPEEA